MASITTILGTDSVSSSRIVINGNFNAINTELGNFAAVLNTTNQTLALTGEVKGGTLRVNNSTIDTFLVSTTDITSNVAAIFNSNVTLNSALITKLEDSITSIPSGGYNASIYVLDATATAFSAAIALPDAEDGQQITFIANGLPQITGTGSITPVIAFNPSNIQGPSVVEVGEGGSITFVYNSTTSEFHVVSAMNATVTY